MRRPSLSWASVLGCCVLLAGAVTSGCSEPTPEPEIASAAPLAGYAQGYPDEVEATLKSFGDAEVSAKELAGRFEEYPGEYEDPVDYAQAGEMLERADRVGRSRAYYEGLGDVQAVRSFYADEKEEIRRKVAGAAQHTAQQAGCNAEVGGAAAVTLDKVMEEKLQERLREGNDAHRVLERHRKSLGKKNAAALEKQIDEVALASYLVHIALVEEKVRLRRLVQEADQVKATADELIETEHRYQAESGRTDEEKKAATERIEAMKTAKGRIDTAVRNAQRTLEKMDQRVEQAQRTHRQALDRLLEELKGRQPKG